MVVLKDFPIHLQLLVMWRERRHEPHETEGRCRGGGAGDRCIFFVGVRQAISVREDSHICSMSHIFHCKVFMID